MARAVEQTQALNDMSYYGRDFVNFYSHRTESLNKCVDNIHRWAYQSGYSKAIAIFLV